MISTANSACARSEVQEANTSSARHASPVRRRGMLNASGGRVARQFRLRERSCACREILMYWNCRQGRGRAVIYRCNRWWPRVKIRTGRIDHGPEGPGLGPGSVPIGKVVLTTIYSRRCGSPLTWRPSPLCQTPRTKERLRTCSGRPGSPLLSKYCPGIRTRVARRARVQL